MKYPVRFFAGGGDLYAGASSHEIAISYEMRDFLGLERLKAVVAHEEGHMVYHHRARAGLLYLTFFFGYAVLLTAATLGLSVRLFVATAVLAAIWWFAEILFDYMAEYKADQYAVSQGYGPLLIEVLNMLHPGLFEIATRTHPSPKSRIERIERLLRGA